MPEDECPLTKRCLWLAAKEWSIPRDELPPFLLLPLPSPTPPPVSVECEFKEGEEILFLSLISRIPLDLLLCNKLILYLNFVLNPELG